VESVALRAHNAVSKPQRDSKTLFACVKQISKKSSKVPKSIKKSCGVVAQNRAEIAHRWSEHFCELYLGEQTTWQHLCDARDSRPFQFPHLDRNDKNVRNISDAEIGDVFSRLKAGKAFGIDSLPPELYKLFPEKLAAFVGPLFRSAFSRCSEPLQFKGGVIMDLLKSAGFHLECSASRGILLSNVLSKGYRKVVRSRLVPYLNDFVLDTMCGSVLHRGTDFASHILNSVLDLAKFHKRSVVCLFVDVVAAFDSVLHSFIVDLELSDESILYLMGRLNLPSDCFTDLCLHLREASALKQASVPDHLHNVVSDILQDNWFMFDHNPHPCTITRSTKQGDPLADILFNFFAARVFKIIRTALHNAGIGSQVPATNTVLFGPQGSCDIVDDSYVDDAVYFHVYDDNDTTIPCIRTMVSVVCKTLYSHALMPNFKKGKSEISLCIRGAGAKAARHLVFNTHESLIACPVYKNHSVHVNVVHAYKHLGNYASCAKNDIQPARFRVSEAMSSFVPLSKHVLPSSTIARNTRVLLASSLIFSRLYFNTCVWSSTARNVIDIFHVFHMKVLRSLHNFDHKRPVSDNFLIDFYKIPSPSLFLRQSRLIYLARFIKHAPKPLVSAVAALANCKDSWYSLIFEDLKWIISVDSQLNRFSINDFNSQDFLSILTGPKWREIVVECINHAQHSRSLESVVPAAHACDIPCPHCDKTFSFRQLPGHLHRAHSYIHPARNYAAEDGICRACLKVFHCRPRLIHHLRGSSPKCFIVYQKYFDTLPPHRVQQLDEQDRSHAARCKKLGISKLHASRPAFRLHGPVLATINTKHAQTC